MTLVESGHSTGGASLDAILRGERLAVTQSTSSLDTIIDLVTRGGWPGSMDYPLEQAADLAANYLDSIAIAEISQVSNSHRDSYKVMALLRSLARNTATVVGLPTIERDISETSDTQLSINTIRDYLTWLERLYVLEHIPAWNPALRSPVKLRQAPKRMLVDPSLAVAGLRATPADLKADPKTLGFLFESMMLRDLLVYAHHMRATLWHYRDDADLEVDAVLTLPSGQWAAIEIKLGYTQLDSAAATLLRLHRKMADSGDPPPTALIVIVGVGGIAHQRDDGVYVIPADLLGP
jgi:predicted AAA+ superfamily ATPase